VPRIVLIDNGSTDGSAGVATSECRRLGLPFVLVTEPAPGKVAALAAGLRHVATPYVATCDADTWYPDHYLAQAELMLERDDVAAGGAYFVPRRASSWRLLAGACHILAAARLLPAQCHAGGAGQVFKTAALKLAGGFDPRRWNYVLEDHEIIHQVTKIGTMRYSGALWCAPSPRKRDRASVKWTAVEQLCYQATISRRGDWFFYQFLGRRLAARRLSSERLRERAHQQQREHGHVAAYPVRG